MRPRLSLRVGLSAVVILPPPRTILFMGQGRAPWPPRRSEVERSRPNVSTSATAASPSPASTQIGLCSRKGVGCGDVIRYSRETRVPRPPCGATPQPPSGCSWGVVAAQWVHGLQDRRRRVRPFDALKDSRGTSRSGCTPPGNPAAGIPGSPSARLAGCRPGIRAGGPLGAAPA